MRVSRNATSDPACSGGHSAPAWTKPYLQPIKPWALGYPGKFWPLQYLKPFSLLCWFLAGRVSCDLYSAAPLLLSLCPASEQRQSAAANEGPPGNRVDGLRGVIHPLLTAGEATAAQQTVSAAAGFRACQTTLCVCVSQN